MTPPRSGPIRTLFIANRGEIARRIERTCGSLGIAAASAPTTGPAAVDLLDPGAVVQAALEAGADALHPGFGFLAENADFAEAVEAAGIRWVGPPAAAIRTMGDKAAARRLAAALGVPVLPGYDGPDQSSDALAVAAAALGTPILVKPSAGGGGKGLRLVRALEELPGALAAARREALAAFGDDRLILERHLDGPRHVEVQVLFDAHGNGVHLGERDCSVQRRHQKVLEETPSPAVDEALRGHLGGVALRLAAAVGYASAGTVEFLLDDSGAFHFLEMNTRLQVEHPVTEAVTGRDLVADQLRIASGEPLRFGQADVRPAGHAVEVRLYAEDAEAGFLPATGPVVALDWPAAEGIRVDAGVAPGDEVTARFDPMLAKVIAWGPDRATAFDRLRVALDSTVVLGLTTNLRFLRWLVRQGWLLDGDARVDSLATTWRPDDRHPAIPEDAWPVAARALAGAAVGAPDPWAGGWRVNGPASFRMEAEGTERVVGDPGGRFGGDRDGRRGGDPAGRVARAVALDAGVAHVDVAGRSVAFTLAPPPDVDQSARSAAGHGGGGPSQVVAPMPGSVIAVHVSADEVVEPGAPVATLEAMKMEHVVTVPVGGTVTEVRVRAGDQVRRGEWLATIEP